MNARTLRRIAVCFAVLLLVGAASAWACPTCKEGLGHDPATANMARGYAISIIFMLSMPFLIFTGLSSYFYWEVCRARRLAAANSSAPDDRPSPPVKPQVE